MRARLRLPSTAPAAARRLRDGLAQRALGRRQAAVVPARAARRTRAVPAHDLVRARDQARQTGRPLQLAVYGAPPRGADARRLRRQRRGCVRHEAEGNARRGGRRHRPRAGPGARPAARRRLRRGRDHELLAAGSRRSCRRRARRPPGRGRPGGEPADLPVGVPAGLGDDAADGRGAAAVCVVRRGDRRRRARDPRRDRRQRAEPQPLLDAAVRRERRRRGCGVPTSHCS